MNDIKLNFVLMGKKGQGKSATGNTLLNRTFFSTSASSTSVTIEHDYSNTRWGRYAINVVDGPGLSDTDMSTVKDIETAATHMTTALEISCMGIDVFLFVIKFGNRFTEEDQSTFNTLVQIFGPSFLDHVIVVMTYGDLFQDVLEEEKYCTDFHDWCNKQNGELRELYEDCKKRCVLINNREKDETMKQKHALEIIKIAHELQIPNYTRYTKDSFKVAEPSRKKLLEEKAHRQIREIEKKIILLNADIEACSEHQSEDERHNLKTRFQTLREEIKIQDKVYSNLQELRERIQSVEEKLKNKVQLDGLSKQSEGIPSSTGAVDPLACFLAGSALGAVGIAVVFLAKSALK